MADKPKAERDPKQRIMDAAKKLFAKQCYAATGMRELAHCAGVNLAMINYYFQSKHKILESLIDQYLNGFIDIARSCFQGDATAEEKVRRFFRETILYMRKNRDLAAISLVEFPLEMPELDDFKTRHIKAIVDIVAADLAPSLAQTMDRPMRLEIIIPAFAGMMLFHFISHAWSEKLLNVSMDDKFYEDYIEEITNLAFYGLFGKRQNVA